MGKIEKNLKKFGEIEKNRKNRKKLGNIEKREKIQKTKKIRKNTPENSKKIEVRPKRKKRSSLNFGEKN